MHAVELRSTLDLMASVSKILTFFALLDFLDSKNILDL